MGGAEEAVSAEGSDFCRAAEYRSDQVFPGADLLAVYLRCAEGRGKAVVGRVCWYGASGENVRFMS